MGYMDIDVCGATGCGFGPFWSQICLWFVYCGLELGLLGMNQELF